MKLTQGARSGHWPTLASAFLYFDVSFMVWVMLGSLGTFIGEELKLSATQKGLMIAYPVLSGSVLRLILGALADRFGAKRTGAIALGITMVPLIAGWLFAHTFSDIIIVGLLLGIAGASFAVALPLASRWYPPEQQGLVMGIAGAGNSGTVLASLLAPRLAQALGWHAVFALALIPVGIVATIFLIAARDAPGTPRSTPLAAYRAVLNEADTLWFCLMYAITFGGFVGLATFLPIFFHDQYGLSRVTAGNFAALCVFAGSFVRPLGGYLADRLGGIRILMCLYGLVGLLATLTGFLLPLPAETVLLFALMALLGSGNGAVFQLVPLRFGQRIGVITGLVGAAGGLGGFFLPTVLGILKDRIGSYGGGLLVFAACAMGGALLVLIRRNVWEQSWAGLGGRAGSPVGQQVALGQQTSRA